MTRRKPNLRRYGIIDKALDDIRTMKECPGHEWEGPVEDHGPIGHLVHCKHCPLAKGFRTEAEALAAIGETND